MCFNFEEDVLNAVLRFFRKMFETLSLYFEEDVLNAVFGFFRKMFETLSLILRTIV